MHTQKIAKRWCSVTILTETVQEMEYNSILDMEKQIRSLKKSRKVKETTEDPM